MYRSIFGGEVYYDDDEEPERTARKAKGRCATCGQPVTAWFSGTYDGRSAEPKYMCDCPRCGRGRART